MCGDTITEHLCFVLGTFGNMIISSRGHSFSHAGHHHAKSRKSKGL